MRFFFLVSQNAVFPADLLLIYWELVQCKFVIDFSQKTIMLGVNSVPYHLSHKDHGLNELDLIHESCEQDVGNLVSMYANRNVNQVME